MYKCTVDISYNGKKYYRNNYYELVLSDKMKEYFLVIECNKVEGHYFKNNYYDFVLSDKMKEFIKVGYFTAIVDKGVTKEFKGKIKKK